VDTPVAWRIQDLITSEFSRDDALQDLLISRALSRYSAVIVDQRLDGGTVNQFEADGLAAAVLFADDGGGIDDEVLFRVAPPIAAIRSRCRTFEDALEFLATLVRLSPT
jgi:hypothetical protein